MFRLFLQSIVRNFNKDKFHFSLNIAGLTLGLAAFLVIAATVFYELSFDRFYSKSDRIYRCVAFLKANNGEINFPKSEIPLAQAVMNDLPEVEEATRLVQRRNMVVIQNGKNFREDEIWFADANVFNVFDFELIEGNKKDILAEPYSIILTEKAAKKYFDNEDPVGKSLIIGDNKEPYLVKGIMDEIPSNSHLQFDMLASFTSLPISKRTDQWGDFISTYTYLVLKKGVDVEKFREKYKTFPLKYWGSMMEQGLGKSIEEWESEGNYLRYDIQPLKKIHLSSVFPEELNNQANSRMLFILSITGLFILLIACLNFINLNTARASLRVKEIGVKKIFGARRKTLAFQILIETYFHCLLAVILAVGLILLLFPVLNKYAALEISSAYLLNKFSLLTIICVPLIIAILAGSYPALYISRFSPGREINGKLFTGVPKSFTRKTLVSFQYAIFIILIISSIVIRDQLNFLRHENPGFNKENVLVVKNMSLLNGSQTAYKSLMLKNPEVLYASFASKLPSADDDVGNIFSEKGSDDQLMMKRLYIDEDFEKTLDVPMVDGSFFSNDIVSERKNVVINEEAAKLLGWTNCKGKILTEYNNGENNFNVIGIIKDIHFRSLRDNAEPLVIRISDRENFLAIRIEAGKARSVLSYAKSNWEDLNGSEPFEYFFLDENYNAQYRIEEDLSKQINLFTIIAILIATIGLYGLISFMAMQRKKEIGIRKVNGARVTEVMIMVNKDLVKWVGFAFVLACPIAYYMMNKWLQNFAYKTGLSWWIFALAGLLALVIALLTVSWQSYRAALRNPVEALRYE